MKIHQQFRGVLVALTSLAIVAGINSTRAQSDTQVVNFDTLPDGASGVALSNYLAGFGITVSGVTSGVTVYTQTNRIGWAFQAASPQDYLVWSGRNDVWQTFTLNFSQPLTGLSFTRCTELPVNGGTAFPAWTATAYRGTNTVGTVGEDAHSIWDPNSNPAHVYSFTGPGITSITFSANTWNFAGVGSPAIDDIVMTTAPITSTVVNFDTLPDGASGVTLSNYLSGFGITTSGVTSGVTLYTQTNRAGWAFQAASPQDYLVWSGRNDVWQTFTLNFSQPLTSLSFTRCTALPVNGGTAFPAWTATAYRGATVVGTAGEGSHSVWSPSSNPARTYSFTGPGITSITFAANTYNFSGVGSPAIDDIVMTVALVSPTLSINRYAGVTISGSVGTTYNVQATTDVISTTNWTTIATFALPSSPFLFIDTNSPAYPNRFYRVMTP
jgi:hypothetical protein